VKRKKCFKSCDFAVSASEWPRLLDRVRSAVVQELLTLCVPRGRFQAELGRVNRHLVPLGCQSRSRQRNCSASRSPAS
jgi:hypothetical protein